MFEELRISNNLQEDYKKREAQIMAAEMKNKSEVAGDQKDEWNLQKKQALRRKSIRENIEWSEQSQSTSMDTKMPTVGSKRTHHHHPAKCCPLYISVVPT